MLLSPNDTKGIYSRFIWYVIKKLNQIREVLDPSGPYFFLPTVLNVGCNISNYGKNHFQLCLTSFYPYSVWLRPLHWGGWFFTWSHHISVISLSSCLHNKYFFLLQTIVDMLFFNSLIICIFSEWRHSVNNLQDIHHVGRFYIPHEYMSVPQ